MRVYAVVFHALQKYRPYFAANYVIRYSAICAICIHACFAVCALTVRTMLSSIIVISFFIRVSLGQLL